MPQKLTTYKNPSVIERAKAGEWNSNQLWSIIAKLEKEGASHKTIKRLKKCVLIIEAKEEADDETDPLAMHNQS